MNVNNGWFKRRCLIQIHHSYFDRACIGQSWFPSIKDRHSKCYLTSFFKIQSFGITDMNGWNAWFWEAENTIRISGRNSIG